MPRTTIVTAAHLDNPDKARWIRDLADNLLAQEFEDWEWVVVDDASPIPPDLPSDVRIRTVRAASHAGPALCRNTGVALARTASVVVMDADDMLATTKTLGNLHRAWEARPNHFIYGDMQWMDADGQRQRVVKFQPYTFKGSLELNGVVPVTAMHSVECWHRAGGWKARFDAGLEDVEYWISAGAAGFCGLKLDEVVLLYRKHPGQRTQRMRAAVREQAMRADIRSMHEEIFNGRYPMGCCGGGKTRPVAAARPQAGMVAPRRLPDDPTIAGGKIFVRYEGHAQAEFRVNGQSTGVQYVIPRRGAIIEIWAQDAHYFQNSGRGKHYTVGVAPPREPEPEPQPEPQQAQEPEYQAPAPELATIERMDPVGQGVMEPPPLARVERPAQEASGDGDLDALEMQGFRGDVGAVKRMLTAEGWTMESLANAQVEELVPYPGIGAVWAAKLIAEANRLWS
jgi:hypothetical protein